MQKSATRGKVPFFHRKKLLNQGYVEGSRYDGYYVIDSFNFIDELAKFQATKDEEMKKNKYSAIFGCASVETNAFSQQEADGIMGLGLHTNSNLLWPAFGNPPDIVQIQHMQGRISKNLFSLCFGHDGGYMTLGDYDTSRHLPVSKVETFDYDGSFGQFKIMMRGISVV